VAQGVGPEFKSQYWKKKKAKHQWLILVIVATQEAEIRRIAVQSQHRKIACETLS
jgi:hypothetical protein